MGHTFEPERMMDIPHPEGADIMFIMAAWMNNHLFKIKGVPHKISLTKEPSIEALVDTATEGEWSYKYNNAHEKLLDEGFLRREYIARRQVDWSPTADGIKAMNVMGEAHPNVYPAWVDPESYTGSSVFCGDPGEQLAHRKAVMRTVKLCQRSNWCVDVEPYPGEVPETGTRPDAHINSQPGLDDLQIEAIGRNERWENYVPKYRRYARSDRITIWVFKNRKQMCQLWNYLDREGMIDLSGGRFRKPYSSHAAQTVNKKLWQSPSGRGGLGRAVGINTTLTSVVESEPSDLLDWIQDYVNYNG